MITIVDYGMGNLRSVQKAFEHLGQAAEIASTPAAVSRAERLVLPGVGAFRDAIAELRRLDLVTPIRDHVAADKPFLGICLGLQLLFDVSYEDGEWEGLGVIPGEVVRFSEHAELKVPHMGWNQLEIRRPVPLFNAVPPEAFFYFVHSYYVRPRDPAVSVAETVHIDRFTSVVSRGNLYATQFHPEKSQRYGLQLLQNFAAGPPQA